MDAFWRHSLGVGVTAKLIASPPGCIDAKGLEEYFAAGLLHDIGKIPLNAAIPGGVRNGAHHGAATASTSPCSRRRSARPWDWTNARRADVVPRTGS